MCSCRTYGRVWASICFTTLEMPWIFMVHSDLFRSGRAGTGWTFDSADGEKFRTATYYALDTYRHHHNDFRKIQVRR